MVIVLFKMFYRCISNGQNGYTRYEFSCGPGTVWDVNSVTCNYPTAVSGKCSNVDLSNETTSAPVTTVSENTYFMYMLSLCSLK